MMRTCFIRRWAISLLLLGAAWEAAAQTPGQRQVTQFRDDQTGISFAYDVRRWKRAEPAEQATKHVVNWTAREGGGLIATCYLQTYTGTEVGRLQPDQIHRRMDEIGAAVMSNLRKRDPNGRLERKEATFADNYPVIRLQRRSTVQSLGTVSAMTVDGLFTSWRRSEVTLECSYPDVIRTDQAAHKIVVDEIERVLRTLHFTR